MKISNLLLVFCLSVFANVQTRAQGWEWAKNAGGSEAIYPNCITTDATGNVYIAGYFNTPTIVFGSVTLTNSTSGTADIYLVKYNSGGTVLWAKSAGGTGDDIPLSICTDPSGNVFICGFFTSSSFALGTTTLTNSGMDDIFLAKYDPSGNVAWAKGAGGSNLDDAYSVTTDAWGNVYFAGGFSSASITFGATTLSNSDESMFLVKYNNAGNLIWAKVQNDGADFCRACNICTDNAGNIYVGGNFDGSTIVFGATTINNPAGIHYPSPFLVKYDSSGSLAWATGGGCDYYSGVSGITTDHSGNVYLVGFFTGTAMNFGTYNVSNTMYGSGDIFVASFNASSGTCKWLKGAGGIGDDEVLGIAGNNNGSIYITGSFSSPTINFGTSSLNNDTTGSTNMFLAKYDTSGNALWGIRAGGDVNDGSDCVATDDSGNVYITGTMQSPSLTFGYTTLINSAGSFYTNIFVAKFNEKTLGVQDIKRADLAVNIVPNPATSTIIITSNSTITHVGITNLLGQNLHEEICDADNVVVDIANLPKGIYFVNVNGIVVRSLVKQ